MVTHKRSAGGAGPVLFIVIGGVMIISTSIADTAEK
jgi:hypothetical protein